MAEFRGRRGFRAHDTIRRETRTMSMINIDNRGLRETEHAYGALPSDMPSGRSLWLLAKGKMEKIA